jgi:hypothetical protein
VANNWKVNCLISIDAAGVSHATFTAKDTAKRVAAAANFVYQAALPATPDLPVTLALKTTVSPAPITSVSTSHRGGGLTGVQVNEIIRKAYELADLIAAMRKDA